MTECLFLNETIVINLSFFFFFRWACPMISLVGWKFLWWPCTWTFKVVTTMVHCRWKWTANPWAPSSAPWRLPTRYRADSRFAPSQWETSLQSNAISHWLDTNLGSAQKVHLRTLKISRLNEIHVHIFLCMDIVFWVYLWNSTWIIVPIHWEMWFLYKVRIFRAHTHFWNAP